MSNQPTNQTPKHYGTNNPKAYTDKCDKAVDQKHDWVLSKHLARCYSQEVCIHCCATHNIDSSD